MKKDDYVQIKGTTVRGHIDYLDVDKLIVDIRTPHTLFVVPVDIVEPAEEPIPEPGDDDLVVAYWESLDPIGATGLTFHRHQKNRWVHGRTSYTWQDLCDQSRKLVVYRSREVLIDR